MTRIRVLKRAIELLEHGFIPYDHIGRVRDVNNNIVSVTHPMAAYFCATAAVGRAIFELTGDHPQERDQLWTATMQPFKDRYKQWSLMYSAFEQMTKEEVLETYTKQLEEWNKE